MKRKVIIMWVIVIFGILALLMWAGSKNVSPVEHNTVNETNGGEGQLATSEKSYDFGTISMKDGLVDHTFRITNSSDKDIFLKKIFTSCMCTTAYLETKNGEKGPFGMEGMGYLPPVNETIKAGEIRNIKVIYDPNAHGPAGIGSIDRFVMLTDDIGNTLQLEVKALVTP